MSFKNKNKMLTIAGTVAMVAAQTPVSAATSQVTVSTSIVDESLKGSITLYKLQSENGKYIEGTFTEQDLSAKDISTKGIEGVTFDYVKIGDIAKVSSQETDANSDSDGIYYTVDSRILSFFEKAGITVTPKTIDGTDYYTSDAINNAIEAVSTMTGYVNIDGTQRVANEALIDLVDSIGTAMTATDSNGKTSVTNLDQGLYMVAEVAQPVDTDESDDAVPAKASAPFLMPIPTTNIAEVVGTDGKTYAAGTVWQYDLTAYPKSEMVTITKNIIATGNDVDDDDDSDGLVKHTDKNVGDMVKFLLTADAPMLQPSIKGNHGEYQANTYRKYIISDTLTDGFTIDDTSSANFKVYVGTAAYTDTASLSLLTKEDDYTIASGDTNKKNGFTLTFTSAGLKKLDSLSKDSKVYVIYEARLDEDATTADGKQGEIKEETKNS